MKKSTTPDAYQALADNIAQGTCTVGVIGLGYVGLPLVVRFAQANFQVIGFDVDPAKVRMLNAGTSYIDHIADTVIASARSNGFRATDDFSLASQADALIICVPTPLGAHREPDLSFVVSTADSLLAHLRPGQLISLESTTYPGTTDEELLPRIASAGFSVGHDVFVVYSPEREDPGNANFTTHQIPKVIGGVTPDCLALGRALYEKVIDQVVPVSSTRVAEMTKLLENIHRAVNIGLVNEIKMVCDRMGINIYEVIDAASTKPFGFVPYYPGPGLGGHCIPIDPFYLTWKARQYGVNTRFIELAGEVNSQMPEWVVEKVVVALNGRKKPVNGSRILMLGIAYKKNVDDTRESPSVEIMDLLRARGAHMEYSDPYIRKFPKMREYSFDLTSTELTADALCSFDCVIVGTDHASIDYDLVLANADLIVDTRGTFRESSDKVVRA